jgi:hypothetical protein
LILIFWQNPEFDERQKRLTKTDKPLLPFAKNKIERRNNFIKIPI